MDLTTRLGPLTLRSPLIAACGTVGSVVDFAAMTSFGVYGAAVAKSVSVVPWQGRQPPRVASVGEGMLNAIGIQNPGVDAWTESIGPGLADLDVPVWGSAVGHHVDDFATVAGKLATTAMTAIEVNLSCPNLDDGPMFALEPRLAAAVISSVAAAVDLPIGAKLSPNSVDIVSVAAAVVEAGASWVVLGNTVWGAGFDIETRRPKLTSVVGGYSGSPLKPIALRCVWEVSQALPEVPIVGCGGVGSGDDVVEFLLAGATAVAIGSAHFVRPDIGTSIAKQLHRYGTRHRVASATELVGAAVPW